ncbi:hypothetical protein EI94DRAFT_1744165 [Lactarius quietus]|nr:hypothetical protein EI94DRAFT_1744165 [Lactarius quietus]
MRPVFNYRSCKCPTSVIPTMANVAFRVDNEALSAACSDMESMFSLAHSTYRIQRPKPARDICTLVISKNAQTFSHHSRGGESTYWRGEDIINKLSNQRPRCGLSGNDFPSLMNQSTGNRHASSQDQELSIPAIDNEIFYQSASFPRPLHQISHISIETQGEGDFPEVSRGSPQPSPPIGSCATSFSRNTTSSKQRAKQHRVRYRCNICRKEFAQRQGVRRHQLEKHEPNHFPHCPTFSWGRLYHFKQHLKKKHPEVDLETATLNMTGRQARRSTSECRSRGDAPRATVWSSPAEPRSPPSFPPLDPCSEALDTGREGARPGAP